MFVLMIVFLVNTLGPLPAQADELSLPRPGTMVHLSAVFNPPVLKGIKVHPDNPFRFDFVLDQGDSPPLLYKEGASMLSYKKDVPNAEALGTGGNGASLRPYFLIKVYAKHLLAAS